MHWFIVICRDVLYFKSLIMLVMWNGRSFRLPFISLPFHHHHRKTLSPKHVMHKWLPTPLCMIALTSVLLSFPHSGWPSCHQQRSSRSSWTKWRSSTGGSQSSILKQPHSFLWPPAEDPQTICNLIPSERTHLVPLTPRNPGSLMMMHFSHYKIHM